MAFPVKPLEVTILCVVVIGILVVSRASSSLSLATEKISEAGEGVNVSQIFEDWIQEHGRSYSSMEEKEKRFDVFKTVHRSNAGQLNGFSDMTYEEFLEIYACKLDVPAYTNPSSYSTSRYQDFKIEDLPESWDWRTQGAVTNVKDQKNCMACWAFATAAALEGLTPFYNKPYGKLTNSSAQELIACSTVYGNNGCKGGSLILAMMYVSDNGLCSEDAFEFVAADMSCVQDRTLRSPPAIKISHFKLVPPSDEVALAIAVYHQPVAVVHSVSLGFMQHKGSGIFMDADEECGKAAVTHASILVGFGKNGWGEEYWILKNSWGTHWGELGYAKIRRNIENKRGICNLATYPIYGVL